MRTNRSSLKSHSPLLCAALAAAASLLPASAAHATYTWTNPSIGFWNDSTNWSSNHVPDSANDASVPNAGYAFVTGARTAHDLSISGNSYVQVYSSNDYGASSLHANNITLFSGELDLLSNDNYKSTLTADSAINIHNAASFNLQDPVSGYGYYTVNGPVINAGAVSTYGYSTFTSPVTNTGTFTVNANANAAIYLNSFYQDDGTLTVDNNSVLHVDRGVFDFTGGSIENSGPVNDDGSPTGTFGAILLTGASFLSTPISNGGNATISSTGALSLFSNFPSNTTLLSSANSNIGASSVTVSSGFTNNGTMTFRADDVYPNAITAGTGSSPFTNAGTMNFTTNGVGGSANMSINGALNNTGTIYASVNVALKGNITNNGAINLSNGASLNIQNFTFNQNAGSLGNSGASHINLASSTFNLNGGRVYLTVDFSGDSHLNLNVSDGQGLVINANGNLTLGTAFRANTTLNLNAGTNYASSSILKVNDNASNFGHIFLHSYDTYPAKISAANDTGNFNNAGLLEFDTNGAGNNGSAILGGTFVNTSTGTVNTDVNLTFLANASNSGSFNVGNGATLSMSDARFNQDGGNLGNSGATHFSITHGGFNYNGGSVHLTIDLYRNTYGDSYISTSLLNAGGAAFNFIGGNGSIHGNLSPGANVYSVANGTIGSANLYVDAGAQNLGSITLSAADTYTNNLYVGDGSNAPANTFANYGTITYNATPGSSISVGGRVTNYGTLNVAGQVHYNGNFTTTNTATVNVNGADSNMSVAGDISVGGSIVAQGGGNIVAQGGGNIVGQGGGNIVAQGGGNIVAQGGGNIVAQGGGNIVGQGGGNIVAQGGGNIVAQGGGNFQVVSLVNTNGSNIAAQGGGNIFAAAGGSFHVGQFGSLIASFVGHNGSAAPSGVVASATTSSSSPPGSNIFIQADGLIDAQGGDLFADNLIQIDPNGTLSGFGTATASAVLSAGTISPAGGTLTLTAPLTLSAGSITGSSTLLVTGPLSVTGPITVSGTPTLHPTSTLSFSPNASLDLTTLAASLLLDKSAGYSLPDLRALLTAGNVFSSTATPDSHLTIATLDTGDSLLATLAYFGDANLDGTINADDYALLDRGYAQGLSTWTAGDFNADGTITSADYLLLDATYLSLHPSAAPALLATRTAEFGPTYATQLLASVPEPTSALACLFAGLTLSRRRRPH